MLDRGTVLLALGVFGVIFCATFWRETLVQNWGLAMENAPESARIYSPLKTTGNVTFKKAADQKPGDPTPATPAPQNTRLAAIVRGDGGNRLCQENDEGENGRFLTIVDYDDTHFEQHEGLKFSWRASGCEEAIRTHGEVMTGLQAVKRIAAVIPRTEAYRNELKLRQGIIQMIEHPDAPYPEQP